MACDRKAIVIISDGASQPPLDDLQYQTMLSRVDAYRDAGGIVICVGVRAAGDGYAILQRLATPGFFINVFGDGVTAVDAAKTLLRDLSGYYCAGDTVLAEPATAQVPDPDPLTDPEFSVKECPAPDALPQLPEVAFDPVSGTSIGAGLNLILSVPGHPDADIRFTRSTSTTPADPSFAYPPAAATGEDYDGANVPVAVAAQAGTYRIKAIARKAGYRNSLVKSVTYAGS